MQPSNPEPNKKALTIFLAALSVLLCIICIAFSFVGYKYAQDRELELDDVIKIERRGDEENEEPEVEGESIEQGDTPTGRVTRITDGDTLRMEINGEEEVVRLLGIDAPEKGSECFNEESTEKLEELALGKEFIYEYDNVQGNRDRYGRLLLHLWVDNDGQKGEFLNEKLVREGYASVYTSQGSTYISKLQVVEQSARAQGLGIWSPACTK